MVIQLSSSRRSLVCGVGINDATYQTASCPYYAAWARMLNRAYSPKYHKTHPSYVGCPVYSGWHSFTTFRAWMAKQEWTGMQLDKDIVIPGRKMYSPTTCAFVPSWVNSMITHKQETASPYPCGVSLDKRGRMFRAQCNTRGSVLHLGMFSTPEKASVVYREFKSTYILEVAASYPDPRVAAGLRLHAAIILEGS